MEDNQSMELALVVKSEQEAKEEKQWQELMQSFRNLDEVYDKILASFNKRKK